MANGEREILDLTDLLYDIIIIMCNFGSFGLLFLRIINIMYYIISAKSQFFIVCFTG